MKQIILNGVQLDELIEKISATFQSKIDQISSVKKSETEPTLLSRKEVSIRLKISLSTLHTWTKLKLLQSYKIGNRVLYKSDELDNALIHSSNAIKPSAKLRTLQNLKKNPSSSK